MVFLAQNAPLYGVSGVVYGLDSRGRTHVVARPEHALPFNHPNMPAVPASQLIRRLGSFRTVDMNELMREPALAA